MNYLFDNQRERCEKAAEYMIREQATVRQTAAVLGISKSTVHKDVTERLIRIDPALYRRVEEVLIKNKNERHLRGGEATRIKYLKISKKS